MSRIKLVVREGIVSSRRYNGRSLTTRSTKLRARLLIQASDPLLRALLCHVLPLYHTAKGSTTSNRSNWVYQLHSLYSRASEMSRLTGRLIEWFHGM